MSLTLYRKYRPQNFAEVIGQEHVKKTLANEIKSGRISHAYLFYGPRGTGKTTMGRIFAKALNCINRKANQFEPCGICQSCLEIKENRNLDLMEIDAASNRGINEIRELRENVRFAPTRGKYKVFIIDECHQITTDAFNALLKTLEEPPAHAIFILVTTEVHKVPNTIVSRCQKFSFAKVEINEILHKLERIIEAEGVSVEPEVLKNIARLSQGYVRDAESLLAQILSLGDKNVTLEEASLIIPYQEFEKVNELINFLLKKDAANAIKIINQIVEEGVDLKQFNLNLIEALRKMLLGKINNDAKETEEVKTSTLIVMIEELMKIRSHFDSNEIPQLPLELAMVKICQLS
jgi:DNA polymerase III subunit gamma/tau